MTLLYNPKHMTGLNLGRGTRTHANIPMTPAGVASATREFRKDAGDSFSGIVKRLGVHTDTCRMFLAFLELLKDWHGIWHFGQTDCDAGIDADARPTERL